MKDATARIKINKLLENAGWRFFADANGPANVQLEPNVKLGWNGPLARFVIKRIVGPQRLTGIMNELLHPPLLRANGARPSQPGASPQVSNPEVL
jgi:hypothetical protein